MSLTTGEGCNQCSVSFVLKENLVRLHVMYATIDSDCVQEITILFTKCKGWEKSGAKDECSWEGGGTKGQCTNHLGDGDCHIPIFVISYGTSAGLS